MTRAKVNASLWDTLADTPEQAANLRARAELMQQIAAIVKKTAGYRPRLRDTAESPGSA
jgi:predicted XRE-type DNA-binding protein